MLSDHQLSAFKPQSTSNPSFSRTPNLIVFNQDHETAASAVRNLNQFEVGGRPLRIDLADSDPFLEGKTTVRGELMDSGESRAQWREREREEGLSRSNRPDPKAFLASLPPGISVAPGTACDVITERLGTMDWKQQMEVLAQMKASMPLSTF